MIWGFLFFLIYFEVLITAAFFSFELPLVKNLWIPICFGIQMVFDMVAILYLIRLILLHIDLQKRNLTTFDLVIYNRDFAETKKRMKIGTVAGDEN